MDTPPLLYRLGLALAIGLLVGAERHWRERAEAPGARTAGIRTFGVAGLLGGLAAALGQQLDGAGPAIVIGTAFLAFSAVFGLFKWREVEERREFSVTAVVVGQAIFLLGALAVAGDPMAAAATAIALTLLLASREVLHRFIARMEWAELRSAVLLLAMAFVVLPLLPDRAIGPYQVVNPHQIWTFAIILAGISFAGYVSVRLWGATRGPLIAGLAGGLASSTAVALTSARRAAEGGNVPAIAGGALAASAMSALRACAVVLMLAPELAMRLLPVLGAGAMVLLAAAFAAIRRAQPEADEPAGHAAGTSLENPFSLRAVLQLTVVLALAMAAARLAALFLGPAGAIVTSAIIGLVDIDAVILSMAQLTGSSLGTREVELSILFAVATNMVAKAAYSAALGTRAYALAIGGATAAALSVGLLAALIVL